MSDAPDAPGPPDAELQRLVSRFLDQTLTEAESVRLEQRLREEPAAKEYCAQALRFDATLQEALDPQVLEWEEIRRVVFDPKSTGPAWSVQRQQTLRYGDPGSSSRLLPAPLRRHARRWLLLLIPVTAIGAGIWFYAQREGAYALRNGDFEAMDLTQSPSGIARSVLYWQDNFSTTGTELCEMARVTEGRVLAHSGRNALRLRDRAFLNQIILNKRGTALKAVPGLRVILTGWSYTDGDVPHSLRGSLRFVASGYPDMIQYEAADTTISVEKGGWHPLRLELSIPAELVRPPSDISFQAKSTPPSIDLNGKELTLSLDNRSPENGMLFLDDLKIEVLPPGK